MENSKSSEKFVADLSAGDNSKQLKVNDLFDPKCNVKNVPLRKQELCILHLNNIKEGNYMEEKVKEGILHQNYTTVAELLKTVEEKQHTDGEMEICKQVVSTIGNEARLSTSSTDNKLSSLTDNKETSKAVLTKNDVLLYENLPLYCENDDKCYKNSKNLDKARKFGVNPIQIGILINKKDFLEHCNMVKNGLKKYHRKKKSSIASNQVIEFKEQSVDQNTISQKATHGKKDMIMNIDADSLCQKSCAQETRNQNSASQCSGFVQRVIQASSCKSVSDLIEYFESHSENKKPKKKQKFAKKSIRSSLEYSEMSKFKDSEINSQRLLGVNKYDIVHSNSKQKLCDHKNCDIKKSRQCRAAENLSVDRYSPIFTLLEGFWFLSVVMTIFCHFMIF
ncbi:uncharacterized protein NPIL_21961 [Nephila pilipes]|uniref:Uncharacterized protein n=1 Tax=Nephila pilipes TaxID=299642 RepID=A0A8X6I5X4_NEPPI|nr:uncharacterized protein NPIL_21961 [Nephila pilipes]